LKSSQDITAGEFRRIYQAQLQAYRQAYGGNMSEQLLKQLGVEQQILQQMVDERKFSVQPLVERLLPDLDSFERSLAAAQCTPAAPGD